MTVAMLVDPGSGRFMSVAGGKVYAQGHAFLTALKVMPSFLAESGGTASRGDRPHRA